MQQVTVVLNLDNLIYDSPCVCKRIKIDKEVISDHID